MEEAALLLAIAGATLSEFAPSASLVTGPLAAGWPAGAPYDVLLIEGAVPAIPAAIGDQLHKGSGLSSPSSPAPTSAAMPSSLKATSMGLRPQPMFDCGSPAIPSLLPQPGFVF